MDRIWARPPAFPTRAEAMMGRASKAGSSFAQGVYRIRTKFELYIACSYDSVEFGTLARQYQSGLIPGFHIQTGQNTLDPCSVVHSCFSRAVVVILRACRGSWKASNSDRLSAGTVFRTQTFQYMMTVQ
jgi:hypothetical protein